MKIKVAYSFLFVILAFNSWGLSAQKAADGSLHVESNGPCSSNVVKNSGNVRIRCTVSKDLSGKTLQLMNKLLTSGADANEKLDQLLTLFDERVPALHGELTPAEEASPPLPQSCPATVPDNALRVYFGSDVGIATQFPVTVLQIGDKPQISFDRSGTNIQISAEVYSRDKRIIARIHNNKFDINPNNYFRIEQDPHTLTVFDQENDMVLSVHFANAHAVKVTGRFAMPNGRTLLVKDEGALVMPNNISIGGNCFEGVAILFKF